MTRTLSVLIVICALLVAATIRPAAQESVLAREVGWGSGPIQLRHPMRPWTVPMVVMTLTASTGVPAGIEYAVEPFVPPPGIDDREIIFSGLPLGEALDLLISLDARYQWRETRGVVVVRPWKAWLDPDHRLNRFIGTVEAEEEDADWACSTAMEMVNPYTPTRTQGQWFTKDQPFTLQVHGATALDVLNAIVRAHGAMYWRLEYRPRNMPQIEAYFTLREHNGRVCGGGWRHGPWIGSRAGR